VGDPRYEHSDEVEAGKEIFNPDSGENPVKELYEPAAVREVVVRHLLVPLRDLSEEGRHRLSFNTQERDEAVVLEYVGTQLHQLLARKSINGRIYVAQGFHINDLASGVLLSVASDLLLLLFQLVDYVPLKPRVGSQLVEYIVEVVSR
jgi:hypothetical protein